MTRRAGPTIALLLLATPIPTMAAPEEAVRAAPAASLVSYLSHEDYPAEAIRNGEQGTVVFRLTVGIDGRAAGCAIVSSSGSASLDETSCRIMAERARFEEAEQGVAEMSSQVRKRGGYILFTSGMT